MIYIGPFLTCQVVKLYSSNVKLFTLTQKHLMHIELQVAQHSLRFKIIVKIFIFFFVQFFKRKLHFIAHTLSQGKVSWKSCGVHVFALKDRLNKMNTTFVILRFQLNISYPATGCQKLLEIDDAKEIRPFYEKRMAAEVPADHLGDEWKVSKAKVLLSKQGSWILKG